MPRPCMMERNVGFHCCFLSAKYLLLLTGILWCPSLLLIFVHCMMPLHLVLLKSPACCISTYKMEKNNKIDNHKIQIPLLFLKHQLCLYG